MLAVERTREFKGRYHVLGGALDPLAGVGPDVLRIRELLARLGGTGPAADETEIAEVIIATDPNTEGEATATYLVRLLRDFPGLTVTRLGLRAADGRRPRVRRRADARPGAVRPPGVVDRPAAGSAVRSDAREPVPGRGRPRVAPALLPSPRGAPARSRARFRAWAASTIPTIAARTTSPDQPDGEKRDHGDHPRRSDRLPVAGVVVFIRVPFAVVSCPAGCREVAMPERCRAEGRTRRPGSRARVRWRGGRRAGDGDARLPPLGGRGGWGAPSTSRIAYAARLCNCNLVRLQ